MRSSAGVAIAAVGMLTRRGETPEAALAAEGPAPGPIDFDPATRFGDRNYRPLDRTGQLTVAAVGSCLEALGGSTPRDRIGLVVGTAFGSVSTIAGFDRRAQSAGPIYAKPMDFANSVINAAGGQAAIWHELPGVNATCCGGTASGLQALLYGVDLLRGGRAEVVIAGGVEEHCEEIVRTAAASGWLPAERLGEAAVFYALVPEADGIGPRLLGGASRAAPGGAEEPAALADALERAIEAAVAEAGVEASSIRVASTGTSSGAATDEAELAALAAWRVDLPRFEVKRRLGECLGASGALQLLPFWVWSRGGTVDGWPEDDGTLRGLVTTIDRRGLAAAAVLEARRER